jgi:integrase
MYVSAATPGALAAYVDVIQRLRSELRAGLVSEAEVTQKLERRRKVTLEAAARSYMATDLADNTRRRVASALKVHLAELAPLEIHALQGPRLSKWMEKLRRRGLAGGSIAQQWWTLRSIIRHAAERGWIASVPWGAWRPTARGPRAGADRLPREATRSPRELRELLDAARELDELEARRGRMGGLEARIACAGLLGMRQGELAGLEWPDVDADHREVAIIRQGGGGRTKQRTVDVIQGAARLFEALERWRARLVDVGRYAPTGPVFPYVFARLDGVALTSMLDERAALTRYPARAEVLTATALRAAVRRAELPNPERWTPHSLRDSFVTLEAAAAGGDLRRVQGRSRHRTLAALVRYLRALERGPAAAAPGFELVDDDGVHVLEPRPRQLPPSSSRPVDEDLRGGLHKNAGGGPPRRPTSSSSAPAADVVRTVRR